MKDKIHLVSVLWIHFHSNFAPLRPGWDQMAARMTQIKLVFENFQAFSAGLDPLS